MNVSSNGEVEQHEKEQNQCLKRYYEMLYPAELKENEYIRMVALRRKPDGGTDNTVVKFVKNYDEYKTFVYTYRNRYDVYNQIATNRNNTSGTQTSQRQRKVLYLDFDRKDYPNIESVNGFTDRIKSKLPHLFIHGIIDSGHGYHMYISIKPTCKIKEVVKLNKTIAEIVGADLKAVSPTQISRVPCTYNHKNNGVYDYECCDKWNPVKVVINAYKVGEQFKAYDLSYINYMVDDYYLNQKDIYTKQRERWNYELLNDVPCYLCIQKIMNEGADKGERNFWLRRIVKMLQMQGYTETKIYTLCREYNRKCRPSKTDREVEADVKSLLESDYKLLGCYESIQDKEKRKWVERECDKANCGTYRNGRKISVSEGEAAKINMKLLTKEWILKLSGHKFLVLTLLELYKNSQGRKGFRIKHLKKLLYSSIQKKSCISDRHLGEILKELEEDKIISITPDKKNPRAVDEKILKIEKKYTEFQKGYIEYYFSIANALIDGKISQNDYIVYIALVKKLQLKEPASYDDLAEITGIEVKNIGKHIRKLAQERCLIIEKRYTDKGWDCNRYTLIDPDETQDIEPPRSADYEIKITLLA